MTCVILTIPMRYSPSHKLGTRRRILDAASRAFRERGLAATGVDEVMRRAGLTHGGFYAHFRDKTELVAEACATGFDEAVRNLDRIAALPTPRARVRALVLSYLGENHRAHAAAGCLLASLGSEMARLEGETRIIFAESFRRHRARVAAALSLDPDPVENERRCNALLGLLAGTLVFARTIADPAESAALLSQARRTALELFAPQPSTH